MWGSMSDDRAVGSYPSMSSAPAPSEALLILNRDPLQWEIMLCSLAL